MDVMATRARTLLEIPLVVDLSTPSHTLTEYLFCG